MRVGVDARMTRAWKTGVGRIAVQVLEYLRPQRTEHEYVVLRYPQEPALPATKGDTYEEFVWDCPITSERDELAQLYNSSEGYRDTLASHDDVYFAGYLALVYHFQRPHDRLLDVGCGTGESTALLARAGEVVVGIDVSLFFLGAARSCSAHYVAADACQFPFRPSSFNIVTSRDLLEHTTDVGAVLDEMRRVLVPDGYLIIWCPNLLSPFRPLLYVLRMILGKPPTPVWAESIPHGLGMVLRNTMALLSKLFSSQPRFVYRTPDRRQMAIATGGDVDAAYLANAIDLRRYLRRHGWQVVTLPALLLKEPAPRRWLRQLLPDFVSPVVLVARRANLSDGRSTCS